jgi:hypothetical protein
MGRVDRQGCFASSPGPVVGQFRVVGGRPISDHLVTDDSGPGKAVQVEDTAGVDPRRSQQKRRSCDLPAI